MDLAYVALGSNLGDRSAHLAAAVAALGASAGVEVVAVSSSVETDPVGPPPQGRYLNAAACLRTDLAPRDLLERLHAIERSRGRTRGPVRNTARTLDLDLLLYGDRRIDEPGLTVPHHPHCWSQTLSTCSSSFPIPNGIPPSEKSNCVMTSF